MEKTLALIHTAPVLVPMFNDLAKKHLAGVRVFHMVDESLIKNTIQTGQLSKATMRRVVHHVESALQAGAHAAMVTCSSIGPSVNAARMLFDFPVLRIDEAMAERAVDSGRRVGVIATLGTTLEPTVSLVRATASERRRDVTVVAHLCEGAFEAVMRGETQAHDSAVMAGLEKLSVETDVIVLAQASMARVVDQLAPAQKRVPILSSPALAMERARQVMESIAG